MSVFLFVLVMPKLRLLRAPRPNPPLCNRTHPDGSWDGCRDSRWDGRRVTFGPGLNNSGCSRTVLGEEVMGVQGEVEV